MWLHSCPHLCPDDYGALRCPLTPSAQRYFCHSREESPGTFLPSYSNIIPPIWHFDTISSVPLLLPHFSFFLPSPNTAIITLFYFPRSNAQHSTLTSLFPPFNVFLSSACLSSLVFLTSKVRQDKQCHWCLSVCGSATHRRHCGCLGNTLTINFQLKQTKRWQLRVHGRCQEAVLIYDKWA